MEMDNLECPICLSLILEPIKIKCSHILCLDCLEKLLIQGKYQCPLDRSEFNMDKDLTFDKETFKKLVTQKEFNEKALVLLNLRNQNLNKIELLISYGNEHKAITAIDQNKHRWKAFIRVKRTEPKIKNLVEKFVKQINIAEIIKFEQTSSSDKDLEKLKFDNLESKIIDNVDFFLHETFHPPNVKLTKGPFEVSRIGWGTFNVRATVTFNESLKKDKQEFDIPLSFSSNLTEFEERIFVDPILLK